MEDLRLLTLNWWEPERPDISDIYFTKVRQRNETEWPSPGIKFTVSLSISVFKKDKFLIKEK